MATNPGPLTFGPHTHSVREVIHFCETGRVLARPFDVTLAKSANFDFHVVTSLTDIARFRMPEPFVEHSRIRGREWFGDIKRIDGSKRLFGGYLANRAVFAKLAPVFQREGQRLLNLLLSQLQGLLPTSEIEEIADDFQTFISTRTSLGISDVFHERLFTVYRAGGYPAGWEGKFPDGRLVVFSRT